MCSVLLQSSANTFLGFGFNWISFFCSKLARQVVCNNHMAESKTSCDRCGEGGGATGRVNIWRNSLFQFNCGKRTPVPDWVLTQTCNMSVHCHSLALYWNGEDLIK